MRGREENITAHKFYALGKSPLKMGNFMDNSLCKNFLESDCNS